MDCVSSDTQLTQSECFEPLNRAAMVEPALLSTSDIIHSLDVEVSDDNVAVQVGEEAVHNGNQETKPKMPWFLEYISCLAHLAVWGILGVLTRFGLRKFFGPYGIGATSVLNFNYLDLPSNMVGSFLMGWLGVVFRPDISKVSDQLAIGWTTGFLGSLTTFSSWNQEMLDLSIEGKWYFVLIGYFGGMILVAGSISFGIETAKGFKGILQRSTTQSRGENLSSKLNSIVDNCNIHAATSVLFVLVLALFWCVTGAFEKRKFSGGSSAAQLWLACMVGPFGVWTRWYLASLNGRGLGRNGYLHWIPFGTLIANVLASFITAVLAAFKKVVKTQTYDTVSFGLEFGLMGCLSTVSTFAAEFHAMRHSNQSRRAHVYALTTICISFGMGFLVHLTLVWIKVYD